ncbi:DUF4347 domain-containing protein [Acaryochloris marina NIES-2412]|uniref:DUF4347 domain-containing protein n=1 Tax=Acaryochloris marina TaxID=155978 RepID=UPI0040583CEB
MISAFNTALSQNLTNTTEIMIYGCELTTDRAGQALVSWLSFLTGTQVKALS